MKHPAQRVLDDLKGFFASKNSFGSRELLAEVARLEGRYAREYDDDRYAVLLDRFGVELEEAFRGLVPGPPTPRATDPLSQAAASAQVMDQDARPSSDSSSPEGAHHEHRTPADPSRRRDAGRPGERSQRERAELA